MHKKTKAWIGLASLLVVLLFSVFEGLPIKENTSISAQASVLRVVDGDTIQITENGDRKTVRLIGVNTPETVDPRKPVECFGKEASAFVKKEIQNAKTYHLELDPSQGELDKYGRILAYVYLNEESMSLNEKVIREGYGYEYTYKTPYKYQSLFKEAQSFAQEKRAGLWADGVCYTK